MGTGQSPLDNCTQDKGAIVHGAVVRGRERECPGWNCPITIFLGGICPVTLLNTPLDIIVGVFRITDVLNL